MSRVILKDALPLRTPLVVQVFPIYRCNFSCHYCHMSIPRAMRGFVTDREAMPLELFQKCVSDMECFEDKARVLRFVGMGEPLLHPNIEDMVYVAKKAEVADTVELLTNGHALTPRMSDGLADAGLDRLVVAVQGLSDSEYKRVSNVNVEFDRLLDNVRHAYDTGKMHVHVKIMDIACPDEREFERVFSPMTDSLSVEYAGPIYPGVAANEKYALGGVTQYGRRSVDFSVCPQAFATMQVNPDGKVVPCYSIDYPCIVGDANEESLTQIWTGQRMREFRLRMLDGMAGASVACATCQIIRHRIHPEDVIDSAVQRLKEAYGG